MCVLDGGALAPPQGQTYGQLLGEPVVGLTHGHQSSLFDLSLSVSLEMGMKTLTTSQPNQREIVTREKNQKKRDRETQ